MRDRKEKKMKGLILRDFYCLKKNIQLFLFTTAGVILLGVLFIISVRSGNVALAINETIAQSEGQLSGETLNSYLRIVICIVLLIPLAFTGTIVECFKEDVLAGFPKTLLCMPIARKKIVASRFLSLFLFSLVGVLGAVAASVCVSLAGDLVSLAEMLGVTMTFSAVMMIYLSIVSFLLYLFGSRRADIIQSAPIVLAFIGIAVAEFIHVQSAPQGALDEELRRMLDGAFDLVRGYGFVFWLVGIGIMVVMYALSAAAVGSRRGDF